MSLGSTLREARERKGLTIAQVAEQTRMIHQLVEEIEQDDFHRISAPVYGRGFIKLFAECVGEEPAPLIQEFTEIYSGLRRPGVRTRPVQTPVENPEVEEPKDRNAPPPRPKVRAVVLADEDEPAPVASKAAPTSGALPEVDHPVEAGKDAPVASEAAPASEVLPEVESPVETGTDAPVASESAPASEALPEVESPVEAGKDAPVASESAPASGALPEVDRPVEAGKDAPIASEAAPASEALPEVESPVETGTDAPVASESAPTSGVLPEVDRPVEAEEPETDAQEEDTSLLGELFDFSFRKRHSGQEGESTHAKDHVRDESSIKISLPQEAPSWDDAPLGESSFLNSIIRLVNIKVVAAVLGGLVLLSAIVFGVVAKRHSKPAEAPEGPAVSQGTSVSELQPARAPAKPSTPTPTPTPTPTLNSNSRPSTPPAGDAVAPPADGKSVYTHNLIPPPDSYVE